MIKPYAERYERYQTLTTLAQIPMGDCLLEKLAEQVAQIDIPKVPYHIN
ncbi:hypothetical protein ACD661_04770 [Legionella lytica]|uniref:Uncharacterized protein n=1 Tax=Legionella lytica TaxID=96232 RepID=A0ABW8D6R9_9GAMM